MKSIRVLGSSALLAVVVGVVVGFGALGPLDAFAALPSATQIESTMQRGDWRAAEGQLAEVLQAHPNNARAHYLYGQVLDREGRSADALLQIQQARTLDPSLKFTDRARFASVEQRIRARADSAARSARASGPALSPAPSPNVAAVQQRDQPAQRPIAVPAAEARHGTSSFGWVLMLLVVCGVAAVLAWTVKRSRARGAGNGGSDGSGIGERHEQMKQTTELLTAIRASKLDIRLSTRAGHEALLKEAEDLEAQALAVLDRLSSGQNPVPEYEIETLQRQLESIKARNDGRPDPAAARPEPGQSAYAAEAERFGRGSQPYDAAPQPPPQPQPPVVVQQPGGFGGGMGGLLTGVLLGNMLGGSRDRVVERDVLVDGDSRRGGGDAGGGLDFGQGNNDWSDNGGGIDLGSSDAGSSDDDWSNS